MKNTVTCMKKILVLAAALCLALCVFGAGCVDNDEPSGGGGASSGEELDVNVGDSFTIGTYNGKALEWDVLAVDKKNEKALLITKDIVSLVQFNTLEESSVWGGSSVRDWLASDFFLNAFSDEEQMDVLETEITAGGTSTLDRVFLLSEGEASQYFEDDKARRSNFNGELEDWWTLSVGEDTSSAVVVLGEGSIFHDGYDVKNFEGVRPAFWLDLSADEEE